MLLLNQPLLLCLLILGFILDLLLVLTFIDDFVFALLFVLGHGLSDIESVLLFFFILSSLLFQLRGFLVVSDGLALVSLSLFLIE